VYNLVANDPELADLGVERVYAAHSADTPPEELFVVIRWESSTSWLGATGVERVLFWAHDANQDFTRIDSVLRRIRDILSQATHVLGEDDWFLTQARWVGEGPDVWDFEQGLSIKFSEFETVSRYARP